MSDSRRQPATGVQVLVILLALGGAMVFCVGGVGAVAFFALRQPADVPDNPPDDPPPAVQQPHPPQAVPDPAPAPAMPAEKLFQRQWSAPLGPRANGGFIALSADGKHVFAQDGGGVRVFDAASGTQTTQLVGTGVPPTGGELLPMGRDKVVLTSPFHPYPTVWHVAGTQAGELIPRAMLQGPPAVMKSMRFVVSLDGKTVFLGTRNPTGGPAGTSLFRLLEAGSGQKVGEGWWEPGGARFTADGSRLFVAEPTGRCRWLKVPGGAQEAGWLYPPAGVPDPLVSMTADGGLILYAGKPMALDHGRYLLDGKTGQVLRNVSFDLNGGPSLVTADGRWLLGVSGGEVVVSDPRTGTELVREPLDEGVMDVVFRADGRAVAARAPDGALVLYTLRRDPPARPTSAPPAPLSPVPDPLPPVAGPFPGPGPFPMAGPFPMPGPVPQPNPGTLTPTPRPPAPPALKARWTAPADIGTLVLKPELGPTFTRDGSVLVQHGGTTGLILAYDAADGTPLPGFAGHPGSESLGWLGPFADRVASSGKDGVVKVWMARTGAPAPDLTFPGLGLSAKQTYGSYKAVSPTGRYTAYARQSPMSGTAGLYRVLDTTTGKNVIEGHWLCGHGAGHISFAPDELRVFVVNGTGKAAWFKLPSGEKDAEWGGTGPQPTNRVAAVSADGSRVVFEGKLNKSLTTGVVDGRTGEVVRPLDSPPFQPAVASLSPDGKLVAVPVQDLRDGVRWHVDVMEVATGKKLGRVSPPREAGNDVPMPRFAPDGKSLAVTFREGKRIAVYAIGPEG